MCSRGVQQVKGDATHIFVADFVRRREVEERRGTRPLGPPLRRGPLFTRQRTRRQAGAMSALGQKQSFGRSDERVGFGASNGPRSTARSETGAFAIVGNDIRNSLASSIRGERVGFLGTFLRLGLLPSSERCISVCSTDGACDQTGIGAVRFRPPKRCEGRQSRSVSCAARLEASTRPSPHAPSLRADRRPSPASLRPCVR